MKLIIQIPCFNEEETLPHVIRDLPKKIDGISKIEVLVINDGSSDRTEEVARSLGIDHILSLPKRRGLAYAFKIGLEKAVELGADIIINTDGDNQYKGQDIGLLVEPILTSKAQMVVGCRNIEQIKHFSFTKKMLQRMGSHFVRKFSRTAVRDVTSGFRAYSRDAALRINIFSDYTYTLESLIQAGRSNMAIECVNIRTNPKLRESRLIKSTFGYVIRSIATVFRIHLMYEPMKFFVKIGSIFLSAAALLGVRYLYFFLFGAKRGGHLQSLVLAIIFTVIGAQLIFTGFLADIIAANRKLAEEILYRQKREQLKSK